MRSVLLSLFVFIVSIGELIGQNLVNNPSFETTTGCGGNGQLAQATGWNVPPGGITLADLYTTCASTGITCSNFNTSGSMAGCTNPCTGNNYTGQIGYYTGCPNCREYLQSQLSSPMVAGTTYFLSFHTKLAPYARYGCNRMGLYVSAAAPSQPSSNQPILVSPQIEGGMNTDKVNWTQVSGTYVASGGENYVTIGIHYNNASLTIFDFGSSASGCALASAAAYYLVDNVWIAPVGAGSPPICASNSTTCPVPLPIELLLFEAGYQSGKVKLEWTTASELNNDFFTIERSANAHDFEKVHSIASKGTKGANYESWDALPLSGISYYRLKQTDKDGTVSYSGLKAVNTENIIEDASISPNPTDGDLDLNFYASNYSETLIEVFDVLSRKVYSQITEVKPGSNQSRIKTSFLKEGIYFIRLNDQGNFKQIKFVKN